MYASARDVTKFVAEMYRPPRRFTPVEAAQQYLRNDKDAWSLDLAPMMVEPMNYLAGREYTGIIFIGPARSSKTFSVVLGGITYVVMGAPGDTLVVTPTQDAGRDFSRTDFDRCIRHSPELSERLSPRARDDNVFDKFWRSGMMTKIGWPAVSQLSAKTLKYVFITDYDRPENRDNVDREGTLWDLAMKRVETYMSRGKCVAETSPGEDLLDKNWKPSTPHEAPPVLGALSLYNRGTRARWYWRCVHCEAPFQAKPGLANFNLPEFEELEKLVATTDLMTLVEQYARIPCPECGALHDLSDRPALNSLERGASWLHEGERFTKKGKVVGTRHRTPIASYWLGGVAAAYQRWDSLLLKYFQAMQAYVKTGDESPLRSTTLTDQAAVYLPRHVAKRRSVDEYRDRLEDWPKGRVPKGVRFLVTSVDVQSARFVVHVYGFGVQLETWLVDRFFITSSNRPEGERKAALSPGTYSEDWDVLEPVITATYPVDGVEGAVLGSQVTCCDSGGAEGVTQRAYEFWRKQRKNGHARRFILVKGDPRPNGPRVEQKWPDTRGRSARDAGARGDVPLWLLNSNLWKDAVAGDLAREQRGPGFVHFPRWVDKEFFDELGAETKSEKGWVVTRHGMRNEAFDLHYYARAACLILRAETIDWTKPPLWAQEPAAQSKRAAPVVSIEDLARSLNG